MFSAVLTKATNFRIVSTYLWLSSATNGIIAVLVYLQRGQSLLGKEQRSGKIPWWSYIIFGTYYLPTYTTTWLSHWRNGPKLAATEVYPGYYIGGCNSYKLQKRW